MIYDLFCYLLYSFISSVFTDHLTNIRSLFLIWNLTLATDYFLSLLLPSGMLFHLLSAHSLLFPLFAVNLKFTSFLFLTGLSTLIFGLIPFLTFFSCWNIWSHWLWWTWWAQLFLFTGASPTLSHDSEIDNKLET